MYEAYMFKSKSKLYRTKLQFINSFLKILKLNDSCTTEHCIRVTKYGFNFARYLNYTEKNILLGIVNYS